MGLHIASQPALPKMKCLSLGRASCSLDAGQSCFLLCRFLLYCICRCLIFSHRLQIIRTYLNKIFLTLLPECLSLSAPSQTAFPVLSPTSLQSSLLWFHHWGMAMLVSAFPLTVCFCAGRWHSGGDTGSPDAWGGELTVLSLLGFEMSLQKAQLLSLDLTARGYGNSLSYSFRRWVCWCTIREQLPQWLLWGTGFWLA